jgi:hypothetical protein
MNISPALFILDVQQIIINLVLCFAAGFSLYNIINKKFKLHIPIIIIPHLGLSLISIITTILWFSNFKLSNIYTIIIVIIFSLLVVSKNYKINLFKLCSQNSFKTNLYIIVLIFVFIIQCALLSFDAKISQGFPWDRYSHIGASIGFTNNSLKFYENLDFFLRHDGSTKFYWNDHLNTSMVTNDMHRRPTVGLLFGILNFNVKDKLYYLGNAYETFYRILLFLSFLFLSNVLIKNTKFAFLVAGTFAFGYWFQFIKDFNGWGSQYAAVYFVLILTLILELFNNATKPAGKLICLLLFVTSLCVSYPESGFIFCIIILISITLNYLLFNNNRRICKYIIFTVVISILLSFVIYPKNFWYLKYLSTRLNDVDFSEIERYTRSLINPYIWSREERLDFITNGFNFNNYKNLMVLPTFIIGVMGYHHFSEFPIQLIFPIFIIFIFSFIRLVLKLNKESYTSNNTFLISFCLLWIIEIIIYLFLNQKFPAYRSIPYIAPFISFLLIVIYFNTSSLKFKIFAYIFIIYNIYYGVYIFANQLNNRYYEADNQGYALTHDGPREDPFNNLGKINSIYTFDLSQIEDNISNKCSYIFIDLNNYWHLANIVYLLESKNLKYETKLPYKDYLYGAGIRSDGKDLSKFVGNCIITESKVKNKIGYKLVVN